MFNKKLKAEVARLQAELSACQKTSDSLKSEMLHWELSPDGVVTKVSRKTESELQCNVSAMQGRSFIDKIAESERKTKSCRELTVALDNHETFSGSIMLRCSNTAEVSVFLVVRPRIDIHGRCNGIDIFGHKLDVSKRDSNNNEDILEALDRSMAIIEFKPTGEIIKANSLFLQTTGYALNEITGKHHRIFCPKSVTDDPSYQQTWDELARGKFISGRFERVDKHGQTVWLEASYNPVIDDEGMVYKVIKFASNVTSRVENEKRVKEAADMASTMSAETGDQAERGQLMMTETVSALASLTEQMGRASTEIGELEQQSTELNKMVSAISAIADQTNLLALNAAIEAARAGEQGRGFAVVADEVRELASRTTHSTKEIMAVFSRNDQSTKNAVNTIKQGMQTLNDVSQRIEETKSSMSDIEAGAKHIIEAVGKLS